MEQLSKHGNDIRRIIRALEAQQGELDLIILKTPTGGVREDLTGANIHLLSAISSLTNVV